MRFPPRGLAAQAHVAAVRVVPAARGCAYVTHTCREVPFSAAVRRAAVNRGEPDRGKSPPSPPPCPSAVTRRQFHSTPISVGERATFRDAAALAPSPAARPRSAAGKVAVIVIGKPVLQPVTSKSCTLGARAPGLVFAHEFFNAELLYSERRVPQRELPQSLCSRGRHLRRGSISYSRLYSRLKTKSRVPLTSLAAARRDRPAGRPARSVALGECDGVVVAKDHVPAFK